MGPDVVFYPKETTICVKCKIEAAKQSRAVRAAAAQVAALAPPAPPVHPPEGAGNHDVGEANVPVEGEDGPDSDQEVYSFSDSECSGSDTDDDDGDNAQDGEAEVAADVEPVDEGEPQEGVRLEDASPSPLNAAFIAGFARGEEFAAGLAAVDKRSWESATQDERNKRARLEDALAQKDAHISSLLDSLADKEEKLATCEDKLQQEQTARRLHISSLLDSLADKEEKLATCESFLRLSVLRS